MFEACNLKPGDTLWDLFCGSGSIALYISARLREQGWALSTSPRVFGVDKDAHAISCARQSAKALDLRTEFVDMVGVLFWVCGCVQALVASSHLAAGSTVS